MAAVKSDMENDCEVPNDETETPVDVNDASEQSQKKKKKKKKKKNS